MNTKIRRGRRGTATVEFAIVAPILFLITIAVLEFWRLNTIRYMAHQAAYQASRAGVVPGADAASLRQTALGVMSAIGTLGTTVDIDPPVIVDATEEITVTVRVPLAANAWFTPQFFTDPEITGRSTLKRESIELN
jgi:Flp pilus assembly protein TadG